MPEPKISSFNSSPPGQDSRLLLKTARKIIPRDKSVLDMGTGSGFLAISLSLSGWGNVSASDIDALSLKEARENSRRNGAKVSFFESDLFSNVPDADWVLLNPPILGKPAGRLALLRKLPGISLLTPSLARIFEKRLSGILGRFLSGLPKKSKALLVLPESFPFKKGLLVSREMGYSVYLIGTGISPPPAPPKTFKKKLPWN